MNKLTKWGIGFIAVVLAYIAGLVNTPSIIYGFEMSSMLMFSSGIMVTIVAITED